MIIVVNDKIKYESKEHVHAKASERYIEVWMDYSVGSFYGWIPVEYRRTGLNLTSEEEISNYLKDIYNYLSPLREKEWMTGAEAFWNEEKPRAAETKKVFDAIKSGKWVCVNCATNNPNWARRYQEIKELGFTFATHTPVNCPICGKKSTYVMCIHIPRGSTTAGNGYETWSLKLRKRIISVLCNYDAFEGKTGTTGLLPDHKFSEIRWDENIKEENPDTMSDQEIKDKFQLLTNQRNQQKREVCRRCFQTGVRPSFMGIEYFYKGDKHWDELIPTKGKKAECGCVGCPWYDFETWRENLQEALKQMAKEGDGND